MTVKVKLFSMLRQYIPQYDPDLGVDLELSQPARVKYLIDLLHIPADKRPVVSCAGRILKADDLLSDGSVLHVFQPVAGG
jgi:sulfur carrier protein ThiS